jgi:hypothetical protein
MNPAQEGKYWRVWSGTLRALRQLGHVKKENELRHWIHLQAIGRDKPHRAFNNTDFDSFLRICAGYTRMGDMGEQVRLLEMPVARALMIAEPWLDEIGVDHCGREAYIRAIYQRVQAKRPERNEPVFALEQVPDEDIPLIVSALVHTAQHKHAIGHQHSIAGHGRARYNHHVGARFGKKGPGAFKAAANDPAPAAERPASAQPAEEVNPF